MEGTCRLQKRPVEGWTMDEHRIGLKPILRRLWAKRGQRPVVVVQPRYQWLYVYAFVQPTTGRTFWLLMPCVSIDAFNVALALFYHFVDPHAEKIITLLVDRAGWHTSSQVECPANLRLYFLPPYSPELQPAEHLWALSDTPLVNQHFRTLDHLEAAQAERCVWLQNHPEAIHSTVNFHWWPQCL
jgi:hypothetical protein